MFNPVWPVLHNCTENTESKSTRLCLIRDVWHYHVCTMYRHGVMADKLYNVPHQPQPIRGQYWGHVTTIDQSQPRSSGFLWLMTWYRYSELFRRDAVSHNHNLFLVFTDKISVFLKSINVPDEFKIANWIEWRHAMSQLKSIDQAPPGAPISGSAVSSPPENQSYFDSNDPAVQHQPVEPGEIFLNNDPRAGQVFQHYTLHAISIGSSGC